MHSSFTVIFPGTDILVLVGTPKWCAVLMSMSMSIKRFWLFFALHALSSDLVAVSALASYLFVVVGAVSWVLLVVSL